MTVNEDNSNTLVELSESISSIVSIQASTTHEIINEEKSIGELTKASIKQAEEEEKEPFTTFTAARLIQFLVITSFTGMMSPLTGSIYLPATNEIQADLGISTENVNLTITVYMIFQAISPTFWGTLADHYGRRPVLLATVIIYCGTCVGLALSPNYAALMIFRMLQAFGSSSVIAVAAGILSDIVQADRRGSFYGFYSLGQSLGPVLGPVLGGIIAQYLNWRWIFWILLMLGGACFIAVFFVVPETLRSLVGNGSGYANPTPSQWLARRRGKLDEEKIAAIKAVSEQSRPKMNFLAPFIYLTEADVFIGLWFNGVVYTILYCYMTSTTKQFSIHYSFLSELEIGVCFLSMGVGIILGSFLQGRLLDYNYRIVKKKFIEEHPDKPLSSLPIYKARLGVLLPHLFLVTALTIIYGWLFYINAPLEAPLIIQFFVGLSAAGIMNTSSTLLIDLFPGKGASITASNNLVRCVLGALATVYIDPGISGVGIQWMFTILGLIVLIHIICIPILIKFGPKWKEERDNRQYDTTNSKKGLLNWIRRQA